MSSLDDQLIELPPDNPVVPVEVGEVIQGKYRIGRIIGFGGMATVAEGHHLELDQPIAIKFLHPDQASRPDAVRRFLSEARAAAKLSSPNIARVLDVGTAQTRRGGVVPFMVMELLQGIDLDVVVMQRGALPAGEAVEYVMQACAAIAEAHALGIVHRDLKPANLFLTRRRDGSALIKLLDFGISKNVGTPAETGKKATSMTGDRELMGSPRYMSPEQVRSAKDVDTRTDIWSLGIILHELLAGAPPFDAENVADTFVQILHAPPRAIAKTAPDVPTPLVEIAARCLQKKPEGRFANVEDLAAALAPYRSPTPILVPESTLRIDDPPSAEAGVSVMTVHASHPKRRLFVTGALAFGALGLVLLAVAAFGRMRANEEIARAAQATGRTLATAPVPAPPPSATAEEAVPAVSAAPTTAEPAPDTNAMELPATPAPKAVGAVKATPPRPPASSAPRRRTAW